MKKILIPVSNSFFARNFLRNGFAVKLKQEGLLVIFAAPAEKIAFYKKEFEKDGAVFCEIPSIPKSRIDSFFKKLEMWSIHSRFVALTHWNFLFRCGAKDPIASRLVIFPLRMILWQLGRFRFWRAFVRNLFYLTNKKEIRALIEKHKPDVVFCPFMNLGFEWHFLKEAKKLGIKAIGMTPSWDNFYSKTFLRVKPDFLLVQTELMKEQAIKYADYHAKNIFVTGLPQYDRYFLKEGILPRDEFFKSIGADPKKKLIVFGCSGKVTQELDTAFLPVIYKTLQDAGILDRIQILIRPHPKRPLSDFILERAQKDFGFLAKNPAVPIAVSGDKWEFDDKAISLLSNTLAHADIVIATCTTFFVEAAIFGKPLIAIGFDTFKKHIYWNSARRFFEWDHLADLACTGGVWQVKSEMELASAITAYIANPALHATERRRIVGEQVVFTDGKSIERIVYALKSVMYDREHL